MNVTMDSDPFATNGRLGHLCHPLAQRSPLVIADHSQRQETPHGPELIDKTIKYFPPKLFIPENPKKNLCASPGRNTPTKRHMFDNRNYLKYVTISIWNPSALDVGLIGDLIG